MRIVPAVLLAVCLAGCNRGNQSTDAIRQGVIDRLSEAGLNVAGMDVTVTSVQINGKQADAAVSITAKGGNAAQGMQMKYHLEQKDNKWVVDPARTHTRRRGTARGRSHANSRNERQNAGA